MPFAPFKYCLVLCLPDAYDLLRGRVDCLSFGLSLGQDVHAMDEERSPVFGDLGQPDGLPEFNAKPDLKPPQVTIVG
jgi:hypothetical protein